MDPIRADFSHSPDSSDNSTAELAQARQHFFVPRRFRDPFHTEQLPTETGVRYDPDDLLVQETIDPVGNRVTVGERAIRDFNDFRY